jgi:quercetin dioxygenase-like cupin family protein
MSNQLYSKEGAIMQQRTARVNPSEETIKIGPLGIRFLLTGDDSGGSVSVFEVFVPVGQKLTAPAHKNDAYEEVLYGVKGVLTWTVDGTPIEVGPGQALCIPRGAVHRFDNLGSEDVKQLAVITPAIMGRSNRRRGRWPARPGEDDGRLPASWHDDGAAPAC